MTLKNTTLAMVTAAVSLCAVSVSAGAPNALAAGDQPANRWEAVIVPGPGTAPVLVAGETSEADALYADAQSYLNLREWTAAERILEVLVRQFPQTTAARRAAVDLVRLREEVMAASRRFSLGASDVARDPPGGPVGSQAPLPQSAPSEPRTPATMGDLLAWLGLPGDPMQERFRAEVGDRIFFPGHSAQLGQRGQELLEAQARWLVANPDARVVIEAHADEPGEGGDNAAMAAQRAEAVKAHLLAAGIEPSRIEVAAFGRDQRIALCESAACRAQNRRVVMRVSRLDAPVVRQAQRPQPGAAPR